MIFITVKLCLPTTAKPGQDKFTYKQEIARNYLTTEDFQCQDVQFIYFLTLSVIGHIVNEK